MDVTSRESGADAGDASYDPLLPDRRGVLRHGIPPELREQAAQTPGGWVYQADPAYHGADYVPPESIIRAYKVGPDGTPTGEVVDNRFYRPGAGGRRPHAGRPRRRGALIAVAILLIAVAAGVVAIVLATSSGGSHSSSTTARLSGSAAASSTASTASGAAARTPRVRTVALKTGARPAPGTQVRLRIAAQQRVWVCLLGRGSRALVNGQVLAAGEQTPEFTAPQFDLYLGNSSVTLTVNGRSRATTLTHMVVTRSGVTPLAGAAAAAPCP